jgi:hypothetical protein
MLIVQGALSGCAGAGGAANLEYALSSFAAESDTPRAPGADSVLNCEQLADQSAGARPRGRRVTITLVARAPLTESDGTVEGEETESKSLGTVPGLRAPPRRSRAG